jgi:ankyrin repeat protein
MWLRAPLALALVGVTAAAACVAFAAPAPTDATLVDAVRQRDRDAVRALLKRGVDVNAPQADGATALHWAAHLDDLETADLLIRAGANVNTANDFGATPLWVACVNGSAPMVEKLLGSGADPNAALPSGETPLMTASRAGRVEAVRLLLAHRADVNASEHLRGQTALMWAAAEQHPEVVRTLIEMGAEVAARSRSRRQLVSTTNNADYSGVLEVEQGGYTPLLFAARVGDLASATLLLAAGANVNDAAASGTSALVVAAHSGHRQLAGLLLERGADPNVQAAGYGALHIAVRRGDIELIRLLLARGANPNARITQGSPGRRVSADIVLGAETIGATPLWLAASLGHTDIMRLLAAKGADPAIDKDGATPLMAAIGNSEPRALDVINVLLELGVDVNAQDEAGNTALHIAATRGFTGVAQALVDNGARPDIKNHRGQTPLALALSASGEPGGRGGRGGGDRSRTIELLRKLAR